MRQLLLIRPKPLPDELLSSWLVRLAWENGRKLHPFSVGVGLRRTLWYGDVDRIVRPEELLSVADATGAYLARVEGTTLSAYADTGIGGESVSLRGPATWILPIGPRKRRWYRPGMQFCPECLATDVVPYFRRNWRLAFVVACPEHGVTMIDRCPHCFKPVNFHRGDYGIHKLGDETPWMFCPDCGHDWRNAPRRRAPSALTLLTQRLLDAMSNGWMKIGPRWAHVVPALFGIRVLCRMCSSNSRSRRFSVAVSEAMGQLPFATEFPTRHQYFEDLEVGERIRILGLVAWLLGEWPRRFIDAGRRARLSRSYIRQASDDLPFWLSVEVEWELDGWYYSPTAEERASVVRYLERHQLSTRENNVRRWLGMHYTSSAKKSDPMAPLANKWCGYGVRKAESAVCQKKM